MWISRRPILQGIASTIATGAMVSPLGRRLGWAQAEPRAQITGRLVQWTGDVPRGWIGGNAETLERLLQDQSFAVLRPLLAWLQRKATTTDAVLAQFSDPDTGTSDTPPLITIDKLELGFSLANRTNRTNFQESLRSSLEKKEVRGTKTVFSERAPTRVGGKTSYSWEYRTRRPNGATYYTIFHFVVLGNYMAHVFSLNVDANKYQTRLTEFDELLKSIQYTAPTVEIRPERVKAALFERDNLDPAGKRYAGWATWRTEMTTPGHGRGGQVPALRADIVVPERKLALSWLLFPNAEKSFEASHVAELRLNLPTSHPGGGIAEVVGMVAKQGERQIGERLRTGSFLRINESLFVAGLSDAQDDRNRNLQMLREWNWLEITAIYGDKSPILLAFEKGEPGRQAFAQWESAGPR